MQLLSIIAAFVEPVALAKLLDEEISKARTQKRQAMLKIILEDNYMNCNRGSFERTRQFCGGS